MKKEVQDKLMQLFATNKSFEDSDVTVFMDDLANITLPRNYTSNLIYDPNINKFRLVFLVEGDTKEAYLGRLCNKSVQASNKTSKFIVRHIYSQEVVFASSNSNAIVKNFLDLTYKFDNSYLLSISLDDLYKSLEYDIAHFSSEFTPPDEVVIQFVIDHDTITFNFEGSSDSKKEVLKDVLKNLRVGVILQPDADGRLRIPAKLLAEVPLRINKNELGFLVTPTSAL